MPTKWTSIIVGGLTYALLGLLIQFLFQAGGVAAGALSCLVILSAGLVAVWHYTSTHGLTIPAGQGAGIGAAAGAVGALVAGILGQLFISLGVLPDPIEAARRNLESQGLTQEQIDQGLAFAENFSNPIIGIIIGLALAAIIGAISGAIGAVVFKKGGHGDDFVTEI